MDLDRYSPVIKAAMLLHNFLVDEREEDFAAATEDHRYFSSFNAERLVAEDDTTDPDAEMRRALVTDNDAPRPSGRPSHDQLDSRAKGEEFRDNLARELAHAGLQRPTNNSWARNEYGHAHTR